MLTASIHLEVLTVPVEQVIQEMEQTVVVSYAISCNYLCHAVCKIELTLYLDVNECVRAEAHNCHSNAVCSDTIGSFECVCQEGYMGDGVNCTSKSILLSVVCKY